MEKGRSKKGEEREERRDRRKKRSRKGKGVGRWKAEAGDEGKESRRKRC